MPLKDFLFTSESVSEHAGSCVEEQPQVLLGRAEIPGRVHRPQHGVLRDALVEPVDQAAERLFPPTAS